MDPFLQCSVFKQYQQIAEKTQKVIEDNEKDKARIEKRNADLREALLREIRDIVLTKEYLSQFAHFGISVDKFSGTVSINGWRCAEEPYEPTLFSILPKSMQHMSEYVFDLCFYPSGGSNCTTIKITVRHRWGIIFNMHASVVKEFCKAFSIKIDPQSFSASLEKLKCEVKDSNDVLKMYQTLREDPLILNIELGEK